MQLGKLGNGIMDLLNDAGSVFFKLLHTGVQTIITSKLKKIKVVIENNYNNLQS